MYLCVIRNEVITNLISKTMQTIKFKKGQSYKEVVLPGRVEVLYTILRTYRRYDGEVVADCQIVANNFTPKGVVENDCGISEGMAVSSLRKLERIN